MWLLAENPWGMISLETPYLLLRFGTQTVWLVGSSLFRDSRRTPPMEAWDVLRSTFRLEYRRGFRGTVLPSACLPLPSLFDVDGIG